MLVTKAKSTISVSMAYTPQSPSGTGGPGRVCRYPVRFSHLLLTCTWYCVSISIKEMNQRHGQQKKPNKQLMEHTQVHQLPLLPQQLCILLLRNLPHNVNNTSFQRIQHLKQIQGQHKYNDNLLIPTSLIFNICMQRDTIVPLNLFNVFPRWQKHTSWLAYVPSRLTLKCLLQRLQIFSFAAIQM